MNTVLLILFITVGISGMFYGVDTGVFVGLGLVPWQVMRLRISRKLNLAAIFVTGIAGLIYFGLSGNWKILILFIVIELYNYWGYTQTRVN